jgi:hypothetical protein
VNNEKLNRAVDVLEMIQKQVQLYIDFDGSEQRELREYIILTNRSKGDLMAGEFLHHMTSQKPRERSMALIGLNELKDGIMCDSIKTRINRENKWKAA